MNATAEIIDVLARVTYPEVAFQFAGIDDARPQNLDIRGVGGFEATIDHGPSRHTDGLIALQRHPARTMDAGAKIPHAGSAFNRHRGRIREHVQCLVPTVHLHGELLRLVQVETDMVALDLRLYAAGNIGPIATDSMGR